MYASALVSVALALLLLGGCGQVITRVTPTPPPTQTMAVAKEAIRPPTTTPAPYTPEPTFTPTITPTPIIYRTQVGDSLLGIAQRFGVTVGSLQETNGIADPNSLQVDEELVIPPREASAPQGGPAATVTPLPFVVQNVLFSRSPLGGLWCFGEIRNTAGVDLEQAAVTVSLLSKDGESLAQVQAPAGLDLIPPDGRAPFAVHFVEPPADFATYKAEPAAGVRGYLGSYYRDLAVQDLYGEGERYAAYTVSGSIQNTGPEDAVDVSVTITLYDALERVVGTRRGVPEHNVIPKGGQTSFSVQLTTAGGPVASYRVDALGRRLVTPSPADTALNGAGTS